MDAKDRVIVWQKEMPDTIGCWYMRCGESDFKSSTVDVFIRNGHWMVDDNDIGVADLEHYHNSLTDIEWCKAAGVGTDPMAPRMSQHAESCVDDSKSALDDANDRIATLEGGMKYLKREIGRWKVMAAQEAEEAASCQPKIDALLTGLGEKATQLEEAEKSNRAYLEKLETREKRSQQDYEQIASLTRQLAGAKRIAKQYEDAWNAAELRLAQQLAPKSRSRIK